MLSKQDVIQKLQSINLSQMAKEVGVTRVWLSNLKHGKVPNVSYDMIEKLSDYFESKK